MKAEVQCYLIIDLSLDFFFHLMLISPVSCSFALFSLCNEALWVTGDELNMLEFEYNIQYNNTIQYRYSKLLPTYLNWFISSLCVGDDSHSNCWTLKCQRSQTSSLSWRSSSKSGSNIWIDYFHYQLIRRLYLCLWNEKLVLIKSLVKCLVLLEFKALWYPFHNHVWPKKEYILSIRCLNFFFSIKKLLKQIHCWNNKRNVIMCVSG